MFPPLSDSDIQRLREVLRQKGVIEAIKVYREITNMGLAEAKAAMEALRGAFAPSSTAPAPLMRMGQSSDELMRLIREALSRGKKIEAIKHYRDLTRASLAQAKEAVETMAAELPVPTTPANLPSTPPPPLPPADTEGGIHAALYRGNMEEAIRLYRQLHGAGQAAAKAAVEAMTNRSRWVEPHGHAPGARSVLLRIVYFVIGFGLLVIGAKLALHASSEEETEMAWGRTLVTLLISGYFLVRSIRRR
jgi:ribosomal protein L7/L12